MKKLSLLGVGALLVLATACNNVIGTSGEMVAETREVDSFDSVELRGSGELTVSIGDEQSVVVETDSALIDRLTTTVENGILVIDQEDVSVFDFDDHHIDVTVPSLRGILLSGSGSITADGLTEDLDVLLSGSGDLTVAGDVGILNAELDGSGRIDASSLVAGTVSVLGGGSGDIEVAMDGTELTVLIDGSAHVVASGTVDSAVLTIDGSGEVSARELQAATAFVDLTGSGNVEISVSDQLEVRIPGSGQVTYYGDPEVTQDIGGSGSVQQG